MTPNNFPVIAYNTHLQKCLAVESNHHLVKMEWI